MTKPQENIGKHIISGELGIGEITEVASMGDKGDFYRVSFQKTDAINFFSVTNQNNYRMLESKENLEKAIKIFKKEHAPLEFDSTQAKITTLKKSLRTSGVMDLAHQLSSLNQEKEIHVSLKKIFENTLKSFVQEIEFVLDIKNIDAWNLLGLTKNNK
jgi:RNA polymerase-interacting CarD/CdnL/TRCF family regulator